MLGAGRPRRRHRAIRISATSRKAGTAHRAAHQRARRLVCLQQLAVIWFGSRRSSTTRSRSTRVAVHECLDRPVRDPVHAALRHRDDGVLMVGAHDLHRAHPGRPGDARDLVRSRGGVDDGHRRRPRDRRDVPDRLGARRCGRRHERADLPERRPVRRLPGRLDCVHGGGRRRDRQHPGAMLGGLAIGLGRASPSGTCPPRIRT